MCLVVISHSMRAPKTKRMQANIHASMAVKPSAFGVFVVTVLKLWKKERMVRNATKFIQTCQPKSPVFLAHYL